MRGFTEDERHYVAATSTNVTVLTLFDIRRPLLSISKKRVSGKTKCEKAESEETESKKIDCKKIESEGIECKKIECKETKTE